VVVRRDLMARALSDGFSWRRPAAVPAAIGAEKLVPWLTVNFDGSYRIPEELVLSAAE